MKEFTQLKKPPLTQINWFSKRFKDEMSLWNGIDKFYLTQEIIDACCGERFATHDYNGTNDLSSNFYLELFGENLRLTETLIILLAYSLHDALDGEYYEVANNIKIIIDEICRHPDTKEKYNELPTRRIFDNPNLK